MLTASDLTFEALFHAAPDALLVVDDDGRVEIANDRTADLFGYDPAELVGARIERLVPADLRERHVELRDGYVADPSRRPMGANLDLDACRKDGSTFPVQISLSPLEVGGDVHVLAAVRDVSEYRTLRQKYQTLLETIPDAVVVADVESGEIIEVNRQATDLFGRSQSDLLGSHQTTLHPQGREARYRALFEHHVDDGLGVVSQFPDGEDILAETDAGDHVPVEINGRVIDLGGQPVMVGVFRDVSTRRAREREIERQLDRVETLTTILSHDLRGPLNVASGYVGQVRSTGDLSGLEKVTDAHHRMEAIIEDVLTMLWEPESPDLEPIRLSTVVPDCWAAVNGDRGTVTVADDVVFEADPRQVRHVFENLFRNAVVHGGDDVSVRVGVLDLDAGLYVEDDGPGIPEDERERVLQPGYSTHQNGTGFGLVIVREVANTHGWSLSITEGSRGGARFELRGVEVVETDLEGE